ncbi:MULTISPECIES: L-rhamnose/proton symporter RhaT [Dysgonomonas]|uniref:L-rhamnose/proton symporter RhaT n=1 Tax=Dysgonomonas TaxID=156973 RepID=UPI0009281357|nr:MULTISPECIES: L-rhamnose/proton symporter RhaT [Dysgonomonas]MBN9302210.1 L-rhamnose/proton symporter RhaT [Dysgonomonas mossii]OJX57568.1 MAG: rhamnose/proton symporter RhaT [Dysgonomonas sp. 37-18]
MNTIIGLVIIAIGSLGQSSSYVPINKVKNWSWECFWLIQGIFAWLVFPFVGALLAMPDGLSLFDVYLQESVAVYKSVGYGILWGIGGLTFGLSMRYLGIALGQSLALGTCSAFGTLIPALLKGQDLFSGEGLVLLTGVSIAIAGIAVIGYAGALKSSNMSDDEKKKAVKDFALKKGLLIAILAGVMSACFNLGLEAGAPIKAHILSLGSESLLTLNPIILLVTIGGFLTNACYCLFQNYKNKSFKDYTTITASNWINNLLFCALAGLLWYSQFFGLGVGQSFFEPGSVMMAFSWSILMSLNVLFSNIWGIILKEWQGVKKKTIVILVTGLAILIFSIIYPQL